HESEVAAVTAEIERTEKTLVETQAQVRALTERYDVEAHRHAQNELADWRERATQLATQLTHTHEQFVQLQQRLAELNVVRERLRAQLAEKEKAQRLRETADFIRDILQKAAPFITETYLFSVSREANQLFREITGRHDVTLNWAKDYEITL